MKTKICSTCNEKKELDCFAKRSTAKDGYRKQCRKCVYNKVWERDICGIYKITSPTGRVYVGQSISIKERWSSHKTRGHLEKGMVKLSNSFLKYGSENHTFEILEECKKESLNCRERHWQDFYDVVKSGLNCVLTECSGSTTLENNRNSKIVFNPEVGVFYYSAREASKYAGIPKGFLVDMLSGRATNKTTLIYADDYEKGLKPHTIFVSNSTHIKVRCKRTGEEFSSVRKACLKLELNYSTHIKWLEVFPEKTCLEYINKT